MKQALFYLSLKVINRGIKVLNVFFGITLIEIIGFLVRDFKNVKSALMG